MIIQMAGGVQDVQLFLKLVIPHTLILVIIRLVTTFNNGSRTTAAIPLMRTEHTRILVH